MTEQETNLAFQKESNEMYYRERAVEHTLTLMKLSKADHWSVLELVDYANVICNFIKGNSNE